MNTRCLEARRQSSLMGWSLLVFYKMLTEMVTLTYMIQIFIYSFKKAFESIATGAEFDPFSLYDEIYDLISTNFWGYLLAIAIGLLVLFLWKGKDYWKQEIWAKEKPMKAGNFICLLIFMIGIQSVVQVLTPLQEWFFNQFGLSAMAALEMATISGSSFSMFVYISFIGPFAEEILFRGLVLRSLKPYGKQMAIFVSALLFALYHGNVVQIPYAFLVGLLLAYVTLEHSSLWAILLHVFNNFVLADLLGRAVELLPGTTGETLFLVLVICAAVAAIVIGICRRKEIAAYLRENTFDNDAMKGFIRSPGMWVYFAQMAGSAFILLFM